MFLFKSSLCLLKPFTILFMQINYRKYKLSER